MDWDQSRVKKRRYGRHKSMRLEKKVALISVPLLWCYPWSWTLVDSSPSSAVFRLHYPSPRLSFCNKQLVSCFSSSAYIWVLFPIFIPILLQYRWKGWQLVWSSRLHTDAKASIDCWNQGKAVAKSVWPRGGCHSSCKRSRCWLLRSMLMKCVVLLVFGKPKHRPSLAAS